jgi:uncharacterized protein (TIGR02145 family)
MKYILNITIFLLFLCSFVFAQKPCSGLSTIKYAGKTYHTVQIGSQCWLKENLDTGIMIDSSKNPSDNGIIEKYCYRNDPFNCNKYGGLYQWNEAMQYSPGGAKVQGICPKGWHLPDTSDFRKLTLAVNSKSNNLKSTGQGDANGKGNNNSGFSVLLAGSRGLNGAFFGLKGYTYFWISYMATSVDALDLYINHNGNTIYQSDSKVAYGFSVRCIKD